MAKRLLFLLFISALVVAPYRGSENDNSVNLPKLTLSPEFGIGVLNGQSETGVPWNGADGITETVDQIMARDRDNPTRWDGHYRTPKEEEEFELPPLQDNPDAPNISHWPIGDNNSTGLLERDNPQTVGVSFNGPLYTETIGYIPPDNNGAVGPTQIIITSNGRLKVYDKTGAVGALNTTTDVFFASVRTASCSDTHVRYDRLSQRWFIVVIDVATPNRVLIAVSSASTITGAASFTFFQFQHDLVGTTPNTDTGGFADYPTLGIDKNALYVGVNVFNAAGTSYIGSSAFVIKKATLLTGTLTVTAFRNLGTSAAGGIYTPQGVDNDDPGSTEGYFIGTDARFLSRIQVRRISTPGGTPTISANITINTATTSSPITQLCSGTTGGLSGLDHRLFAAQLKKNTITGVSTLWTAQNMATNNTGVSGTNDRNSSRWYEISNMTTTPAINQSGTLFDNSATKRGFWIPSVCMSGQGHMAMITSTASSTNKAEIAISGRLSSDVLGTVQTYTLAQSTTFSYDIEGGGTQRWGDYSQVVVDPTDNMTMWGFEEYCNASNSWCVRCIQLKAPPPATITSAANVPQSQASVNSTIVASSVSGSGFYDPGSDAGGPGFTNHISATVTGGVTVNSVTFTDATHLTLSLNTTAATIGLKNITITNPDGQFLTVNNILTVDAPSPVTMSSFIAAVFAANNVKLSWMTAIEVNNSGFRVERSRKNDNNWQEIGFVNGNGTSYNENHYSFIDTKLGVGKYDYRLRQMDYNGSFEFHNLSDAVIIGAPPAFEITQSYPNPSNPKSKIDYQIPFDGKVEIKVFDLLGREVAVLVNETKEAGYYSADFDGSSLASGIYLYRIEVKDTETLKSISKTMKMVLVK